MTKRAFLIPLLSLAVAASVRAQGPVTPSDVARQVTLFGVMATPGDARVDPKLSKIEPQLRKLLPNHGFRMLGVKTKRLTQGQTLTCPLGDGYTVSTTLTEPVDLNGKVQLRCEVFRDQAVMLESQVTTPANQLFFCDKLLPDGTRLLVGIGAR